MKFVKSTQEKNHEIEKSMRNIARNLLKEKKVDLIIGYSKGTVPLSIAPLFIKKEEDVEKLTWNNLCYVNLAKYLMPKIKEIIQGKEVDLKVGIVAKGCVARAIVHLAVENQINLNNMRIIGINCNGTINRRRIEKEIGEKEILEVSIADNDVVVKGKGFEKRYPFDEYLNELCKTCQIKSPPMSPSLSNIIVGDSQEIVSVEDDYKDITEFESKTPDEKWNYIKELLKDCTRCYACREACPLCYCNLCFIDQNLPYWFGKTSDLSDIIVFHMIRALHVAGRCVGCGACSSVCPMGIDLNLITRKLEKVVKERFKFISGLNLETIPPMMTYTMDDKQEFMLEED